MVLTQSFDVYPLGDKALTVKWSGEPEAASLQCVLHAAEALERAKLPGVTEITSAYLTVTVYYEPLHPELHPLAARGRKLPGMPGGGRHTDGAAGAMMRPGVVEAGQLLAAASPYERLRELVDRTLRELQPGNEEGAEIAPQPVRIAVCYGGSFGPDLAAVAERCGLTPQEAAELHSSVLYTVAMVGFSPGFPYLIGMPPQLAVPRRSEPRLAVPAGSVAIGGGQTGIYPQQSPGGWHVIGRTPDRLFHPLLSPPSLLRPGDKVKFVPVSEDEYARRSAAGAASASSVAEAIRGGGENRQAHDAAKRVDRDADVAFKGERHDRS